MAVVRAKMLRKSNNNEVGATQQLLALAENNKHIQTETNGIVSHYRVD